MLSKNNNQTSKTQSIYCYPGSDVLINNLDLTNQEELDVAERRITTLILATMELKDIPSPNKLFTIDYYLGIHKELFEYIYPFAGQTRNKSIAKGRTFFCTPENIYYNLKNTLYIMGKDMTKLKTRDDITTFLADGYGELNIIHPFREGNGRVAREFLRECVECMNKYLGFNYELDFSGVTEYSSKRFMHASQVSALTADNQELKEFFSDILKEKQQTKTNESKKGR